MPCHGTTKTGKPCKAAPLKGTDRCISHSSKETQASVGFGGAQPGSGRPRQPRVTEVYADELHRRVSEHVDDLIGRLVAIALDAERTVVVGTGPNARTEIAPDQALQLAALRELNDRILGRPKQTSEITGPNGGAVEVLSVPVARDRRDEILSVLAAATSVPASPEVAAHQNGHNGNGNGHHH